MTLVFCDGFDHYGTANATMDTGLARKWTSFSGGSENIAGRFGGRSCALTFLDTLQHTLVATSRTIIVGYALFKRIGDAFNSSHIELRTGTTIHVSLGNQDGTGILQVFRGAQVGGTVLASGTNFIKANGWNYIEMKIFIDNTVGTVEVKLNGFTEILATGLDTQNAANNFVDNVRLVGESSASPVFDDFYICDNTGSVNNDFLGDVYIETVFTNAAGTTTNFTVSGAASNYLAVDDNPTNDETDYVTSSTLNHKDTYNFTNLATVTDVKAVQLVPLARKTATSSRQIVGVIRSSSTDYDQETKTLTTSYLYYPDVVETDPATATTWTAAGVNAAEFGIKIVT